jgi:hypothetical protein
VDAWTRFRETLTAPAAGTFILDEHHTPPLDPTRFLPLTPATARLACVDAGSAEIITLPHACLAAIRLCGIVYHGTTRERVIVRDGFLTMHANGDHTVTVTSDLGRVEPFNLLDPHLRTGTHRATWAQALDLIRTEMELALLDELARDGITAIRDGDLLPTHPRLIARVKQLTTHAHALGISKTSTLTTDTGHDAITALHQHTPTGTWLYAADTINNVHLCFAKLHPHSRHTFRIDTTRPDLIATLLPHSTDPTFLGYPYPLILADRLARIPRTEQAYWKAKAMTRFPELARHITTTDAHEVLDTM